jgi:hypothetical protein
VAKKWLISEPKIPPQNRILKTGNGPYSKKNAYRPRPDGLGGVDAYCKKTYISPGFHLALDTVPFGASSYAVKKHM